MKFIAVILSVYVLSLTAMPCEDIYADNSNSTSIELIDQSQIHSEEFEVCTPFSFCNCCQTLDQPISKKIIEIKVAIHKLFVVYQQQDYTNPITLIWHPPKI
jgi:hypothetical protein